MNTTSTVKESPRRQHRTLAEARDLVAAWRQSGMRKVAWCLEHGVPRSALSSCVCRVERAGVSTQPASSFIALRPPRLGQTGSVQHLVSSTSIAIELADGVRITGLDAVGVVAVVRLLRESQS